MRLFTILVGVATLLSLGLQLSGYLRTAPNVLWYSSTFLGGVTLGLTLSLLFAAKGSRSSPLHARQVLGLILFSATGLLVFILFLMGVVLDDAAKRTEAQQLGSAVSGFLIFLLIFFVERFFEEPVYQKNAVEPSQDSDY